MMNSTDELHIRHVRYLNERRTLADWLDDVDDLLDSLEPRPVVRRKLKAAVR